jgi:hypothetical protein
MCTRSRGLYARLAALTHSNGAPLVKVFGKHDHRTRASFRVPSPALVLSPRATISYRTVDGKLLMLGFHIRTDALLPHKRNLWE